MASNSGKKSSKLFDDVPEPDYDHLNPSHEEKSSRLTGDNDDNDDDDDDDADDCKKNPKKDNKTSSSSSSPSSALPEVDEDYILGTLIVRIVAARNLDGGVTNSPSRRRIIQQSHAPYNPYASVQFGGQTQRTTVVPDSVDPLWPRSEAMYMDVALPFQSVTYRTMIITGSSRDEQKNNNSNNNSNVTGAVLEPINNVQPMLTVALFSATADETAMTKSATMKKKKMQYPLKKTKQKYGGDSDDPFLGSASLDVTPLLTGKKVTLDKWLSLSGGKGGSDVATVRCVCEYETSDPAPCRGDIVRFTRFCEAADLYPVPITLSYKVQEVSLDGSDIVLEYTTPEGWICTFIAHRFMVLCEERCSATMLDRYQDQMVSLQERLSESPMLREVQSTVTRVPDEGLLSVSLGAIQGAGSLLDRWWNGGVDTALGDIQYATNWDGRFNNNNAILDTEVAYDNTGNDDNDDDAGSTSSAASTPRQRSPPSPTMVPPPLESPLEADNAAIAAAIPGMPCCPITGESMVDPVVAADGHTYERMAIARWFHSNNKSPLTGSVVPHKHLVPNYVLLSSIQELSVPAATATATTATATTATATMRDQEASTADNRSAMEEDNEEAIEAEQPNTDQATQKVNDDEDHKMPAV